MPALSRKHIGGVIGTVCCLAVLVTGMVITAKSRSDEPPPLGSRAHYPLEYHLDGSTILRRLDVWNHSRCAEVVAASHTAAVADNCEYAVEVAYGYADSDLRLHQLVLVYDTPDHASEVADRFTGRAVAQRFEFSADAPRTEGRLGQVGEHVLVTAFDGSSGHNWALAFHDDNIDRIRQR